MCLTDTGHAEVIRIEYDPKKVGYDRLLEVFWAIHDPTQFNGQGVNIGSQYRSVIFFHTEEQEQAAIKSREIIAKEKGQILATQILEEVPFFMAEDYHQQYYVKTGVAACPIPVVKAGGGG